MKKIAFISLFACVSLFACETKTQETEDSTQEETKDSTKKEPSTKASEAVAEDKEEAKKSDKPRGSIYRADGLRPGVASEWLQVAFSKDQNKIEGVWYWTTDDENKISLKILEQEFTEGEISGFTATVLFPGSPEKIGLGLIEGKANLSYADGKFEEFEYESVEN